MVEYFGVQVIAKDLLIPVTLTFGIFTLFSN